MKLITLVFIYLYVSHIIYGPYYLWTIFYDNKSLSIGSSNIITQRMVWITYVSFLSIANFNENPNTESFFVALFLSSVATIGYTFVFYKNNQLFFRGLFDHIVLLNLPLIYLANRYKSEIVKSYDPSLLSLSLTVYICNFIRLRNMLYKYSKEE